MQAGKQKSQRTFIRKWYTSYVTGSMAGRDDGQPLKNQRIDFDTIHEFAADQKRDDERIEIVSETVFGLPNDWDAQVAQAIEQNNDTAKTLKRSALDHQIRDLQRQRDQI